MLDLGWHEHAHEHLDDREQVDPGGPRDRFVEAVAAMANTGRVSLTLIDVEEDAVTDRLHDAQLLRSGTSRPQEARCRALQPYVPLEIAWASKPGGRGDRRASRC